jgi:hypothetical protein
MAPPAMKGRITSPMAHRITNSACGGDAPIDQLLSDRQGHVLSFGPLDATPLRTGQGERAPAVPRRAGKRAFSGWEIPRFPARKTAFLCPGQAARAARIRSRISRAAEGMFVPGPKIAFTPAFWRNS